MLTTYRFGSLDFEVCGPLFEQGLAHANHHFEVEWINDIKNVALMDELVVCHVELDNPARYSGRDICNLSADGAVPRPGSGDIVLPCQNRDQDGDQCDGERRKAPSDREPQTADGTARYPRRRR